MFFPFKTNLNNENLDLFHKTDIDIWEYFNNKTHLKADFHKNDSDTGIRFILEVGEHCFIVK